MTPITTDSHFAIIKPVFNLTFNIHFTYSASNVYSSTADATLEQERECLVFEQWPPSQDF